MIINVSKLYETLIFSWSLCFYLYIVIITWIYQIYDVADDIKKCGGTNDTMSPPFQKVGEKSLKTKIQVNRYFRMLNVTEVFSPIIPDYLNKFNTQCKYWRKKIQMTHYTTLLTKKSWKKVLIKKKIGKKMFPFSQKKK